MQHRQVPPIAHLRQSISRDIAKPIQSPLSFGRGVANSAEMAMQSQPSPESSITEAVQDLALEIYARLAVKHIEHNQATDRETLQGLAQSAQLAAKAYFESMGVQFNEEPNRGQS